MGWLFLGVVYSIAYAGVGYALRDHLSALSWFRAAALAIPPLTAAMVIVRRRHTWTGCQWLFWSTIALGLAMSAIGLTGWAADELLFGQQSWLAWPVVFALFGNVAPLFALLAQPHQGPREPLAATTSVDIAGLAVVTGFLYSFFVTGIDAATSAQASSSLIVVSELQSAVVALGLIAAVFAARPGAWRDTYRRLALGAVVSFVTLTMSNAEAGQAGYRSAFVYDFTWILPFAFFPWAATGAPASNVSNDASPTPPEELTRPRPWVIFTAVALLPFIDFGLRQIAPASLPGFRDLSTAVAMISVLPLLVARIATERAELQQASSTTRLLAEVIEQAQDLILVLTPDGGCRHANDAFCAAMGYSAEELKKARARDLVPEDAMSIDDLQSLFRAKGVWRGTITRTRRDGTTFPVAASMASILDERGRVAYVVSVERDISEERRLREQLIHSERLSAVGQLVAGVAHELNNPLQSVIGIVDVLLQSETRDDIRRDLDQVRVGGYRAARIVKSLLSFARRSASERSIGNLNEMLKSTLELRAYELKHLNISVQEEFADPAPLVFVNSDEIRQVMLNLILNAEHAIRGAGRGGTMSLRTGGSPESAFIEIADDGPGVPPDERGRIFEPFFTTKGVGEGTGLGLSISLGIAEAHGGSLTLVPRERGACFRLTLPSLPTSVRTEVTDSAAGRRSASVI
jgi:PAS domain S-box-containing protein